MSFRGKLINEIVGTKGKIVTRQNPLRAGFRWDRLSRLSSVVFSFTVNDASALFPQHTGRI